MHGFGPIKLITATFGGYSLITALGACSLITALGAYLHTHRVHRMMGEDRLIDRVVRELIRPKDSRGLESTPIRIKVQREKVSTARQRKSTIVLIIMNIWNTV
jgi:hypothetical protein